MEGEGEEGEEEEGEYEIEGEEMDVGEVSECPLSTPHSLSSVYFIIV